MAKTFQDIDEIIYRYLKERDWQDNDSRSLAISIALEANELLEHYQWGEKPVGTQQEIAEELADIFIYAFQFARNNDIDLSEAILQKLEKTKVKYPAKDFKGKNEKNNKKAWLEAKLKHKKDGL